MDFADLAERLSRVEGLRLAYAFGSSARGSAGPRSDVDVAIVIEPPLDPRSFGLLQEMLSQTVGRDVDLVDLGMAPPLLRFEVVSSGVRLVVRDEDERTAFEARAMLDYMDTRHLRNIQHHYLRERSGAPRGA